MKIRNIKGIISTTLIAAMLCGTVTGCGMSFKATTESATAPSEVYTADDAFMDYGTEYYSEPAAEEYEAYCEEAPAAAYDTADSAAETYYDYDVEESEAGNYKTVGKSEGSYLDDIYDYDRDTDAVNDGNNTEEYSELNERGYLSVKKHPLSTFAADVDTASYANLRRMINDGYNLDQIPEGAVRIEEMINYFDYDYEGPKGSDPFGVNTVVSSCPWNKNAMLMSIGLKTEDIDFSETPDSNLVFLIDVSGSMADEDKLPLLQDAFCMLAEELSEKDRVSIVTYANGVDTVLKGAKGSDTRTIKKAIKGLMASGGTNGGEGIKTAYRLAEKYFIKGGNNRVILATDGDLNLGITSVDDLNDLISEKKESGVYLSVIGFGKGNIKDNRMETLADNGNGNYSYIDSEREAKKVLIDELSSNMLTVCKDVKLQVEFNPEVVKGYRLVGYANRVMKDKDFNDDKKDGGEIGAGHEVTVLYEIIPNDDMACDLDEADYMEDSDEILTLSIRYKKPSGDKSSLLTYPVTFDSYEADPSDDFLFQSAVAEFGLVASDSLFSADADIDNVVDRLRSIDLNDEYKKEFYKLVRSL